MSAILSVMARWCTSGINQFFLNSCFAFWGTISVLFNRIKLMPPVNAAIILTIELTESTISGADISIECRRI